MILTIIQTFKIGSKSRLTHLIMIYHNFEGYPNTHGVRPSLYENYFEPQIF